MAGLTPSLVGLSLKPATWRRVPTGAGGDDNLRKSARSAASHYYHFVCPVLRATGMPLVGPEGCMVEANKRWKELNEEEKVPFIRMNLQERESLASGGNQLTEEQLRALCPESILAEYDAAKASLEANKSATAAPPPPPAPMRAPASTGPVLPLATPPAPGEAGPSTTDVVLQVAQQRDELKRRAEEALAMAGEVKRQKIEAVAAEKEAAARAKAAEKEAAAQAKAAEKAAAAKARAEAKAAADAVKAAEKEAAAQVKAAIKEVAAQAKAAEKEAAVLTKAAEKAEKEAAAEAKVAEKAAADAAKAAAKAAEKAEKEAAAEAKAAEKAQEDARDEAEAKMLGISVTTLRVRRTKALKAAKEAGYETVEAHAAVLAAEAAEKAAADATKAAEKEAAAQAKVAEKAAADAAKAAAKAAEKAEKEAAAEAKAAEKAQEDARDEAEAKTLGISVTTLRVRRTKALKAAKEAGYETAEAHAAALAAEAAEAQAKAEEAAAAQAAAEAAAKAAAEAEAKRKEREEACAELEEQIHRLRWQQRSMAEDYAQMLKEWEENNCGDAPAWMGEMSTIFQKLSDAIQDAENKNPVMWEISEGGKHAQFADKFADEAEKEAMGVDEADEEGEEDNDDDLPEGYTVTDEAANALAQGKAKGRGKNDDDVEMDVEDDTIQIDLRITLQNVRDNSEEKEKWRTQVIHTDYENGKAAYVTAPDPQPDNPSATKLVRSDKPKEPYPSDIPQEFINYVHAEVNAIERATKGMASAILSTHGGAPASLLASVSAAPMTAFDGTSNPTTQQNMAAPKGKGLMRTLYAVEMHLPANVAASREQANLLVEGFLTATMDDWSNATGLRVVQVSGVQDMESYMEGIFKQQKVQADGPLTKDEIAFMVAKFGPNWKDPEVARPDDRMAFLEMYRAQSKQMGQDQNIKRAVADQRQVGASDADADRVREEAGAGAGPEGGSRRKPGKAAVQRREV